MSKSILDQAKETIEDRRQRVDGPEGNFERIAQVWAVVFGHEVTARQVALCMIGLKFARECFAHWTDNLVDLCGYADCLALIEGDYAARDSSILFTCDPAEADKAWLYNAKKAMFPNQPHRWRPCWEPNCVHGSGYGFGKDEGSEALCACLKPESQCDYPTCQARKGCD